MTTQPAPLLLTAECAAFAAKLDDIPSFLQIRLQALADGRTACVERRTEDECRAEFEAWINVPPYEHMCDRNSPESAWPGQYKRYETQLAWESYLASRRAMGAVR